LHSTSHIQSTKRVTNVDVDVDAKISI